MHTIALLSGTPFSFRRGNITLPKFWETRTRAVRMGENNKPQCMPPCSSRMTKSPIDYLYMCLYIVALDTPTICDILSLFIPIPYRTLINNSFVAPTFFSLSLEWNIGKLYLSIFPLFNKLNNIWCSFLSIFVCIGLSLINNCDCWFPINIIS